jgi:hypothetical protein
MLVEFLWSTGWVTDVEAKTGLDMQSSSASNVHAVRYGATSTRAGTDFGASMEIMEPEDRVEICRELRTTPLWSSAPMWPGADWTNSKVWIAPYSAEYHQWFSNLLAGNIVQATAYDRAFHPPALDQPIGTVIPPQEGRPDFRCIGLGSPALWESWDQLGR